MKNSKQRLLIDQIDRKVKALKAIEIIVLPKGGWINFMRIGLNMSMRQLGNRMKITPQSVNHLEKREISGAITIKTLREAAKAMDMKFVYAIIPKGGSIEKLIEKRAKELATEIVLRTSNTMKLEDQENSKNRLSKAINLKTEEIINDMPKYLWE